MVRPVTQPVAPQTMPRSKAWLDHYYGAKGAPFGERKPSVIDHARCAGPLIASIDDEPLVFFGPSFICNSCRRCNAAEVQRLRDEGHFDKVLAANPDSS